MMNTFSHEEREALKQEIFHSLHCALPGNVISFDPEAQTAAVQPAVRLGSLPYPVLTDVTVFMPIPFEINPGDACLVIFSDVDIDAWFETGEASVPNSPRSLRCRTGLRLWDSKWKGAVVGSSHKPSSGRCNTPIHSIPSSVAYPWRGILKYYFCIIRGAAS